MPSAPDTADLALHNLATQRAIALVSALPPLQAEVIMLRVVAGLTPRPWRSCWDAVPVRSGWLPIAAFGGLQESWPTQV